MYLNIKSNFLIFKKLCPTKCCFILCPMQLPAMHFRFNQFLTQIYYLVFKYKNTVILSKLQPLFIPLMYTTGILSETLHYTRAIWKVNSIFV